MKEKKLIIIIVVSIIVSILVITGVSYALFSKTLKGDKTLSIESGTLKIDFEEGDTINLENTGTLSDEEGLESKPYTFTITNSGDIKAYYTISFQEDTDNNTLDTNFVKYKLTSDKGYDSGIKVMKEVGNGTFIVKEEDTLGTSADDKKIVYTLRLWLSDTADNSAQGTIYKMKVLVKGYSNKQPKPAVDTLLTEFTNDEAVQDYDVNYNKEDSSAKENKMYVFDHEAGTQQSDWSSDELKDYRYIGADPNNYVTFNNEEAGWRIIGIETVDDGTGKREKRIKLIRKDLLPVGTDNYLSWDNKPSGTGSSEHEYGSNDWTDSRLMMVLNPGYEEEANATGGKGSLYWNRQSGSCPLGSGTTVCNFTSTGLKEEAQKLIGDAKWYLGGTVNYQSTSNGTANHFYSYERGETVYSSSEHPRKTNWTGKVGLMYPSDYGYATSGGTTANRATCLAKELYNWDSSSGGISDCKTNDWLFINNKYQWTIAPRTSSSYDVFIVYSDGSVSYNFAYYSRSVARPVVYLVSNIKLLKGIGSETDPFEFGL